MDTAECPAYAGSGTSTESHPMFTLRRPAALDLPAEDGVVSATTLPADRDTSQINYETATFGLG